jgi:hypothetical protein
LPFAFDITAGGPPGISDCIDIDPDCTYNDLQGFVSDPKSNELDTSGIISPFIRILPVNVVVPIKVLLPVWVVDPVILREPVNVVVPISVFDPVVNKLPVTV